LAVRTAQPALDLVLGLQDLPGFFNVPGLATDLYGDQRPFEYDHGVVGFFHLGLLFYPGERSPFTFFHLHGRI
jgi:hypothetical protein